MAEAEAPPEPWRPGLPVRDETALRDIAAAMAFGHNDQTFVEIAELLTNRKCCTVADWKTWHKGEFLTLVKVSIPKTKKHRNAYLAGFESATGHKLTVDDDVKSENPMSKVKKQSGGDTTAMSAKQVPSENFNGSKWLPDMRVYEGVPTKAEADYIEEEQEKLYLDKLFLCAIVRSFKALSPMPLAYMSARLACALAHASHARSHDFPAPLIAGRSRAFNWRVPRRRHAAVPRPCPHQVAAGTLQAEAYGQAQ